MGANIRGFANLLNTDGTFLSGAINNTSVSGITDLPTAAKSDLVLISSQTASSDASLSFTSGLDSTYDVYCFKFNNIHPSSDVVEFEFQGDIGTNTYYNQTMTTTVFRAFHDEADTATGLAYYTARDKAQETSYQSITDDIGNGNDECFSGELWLYNPSSTTYVKHFKTVTANYNSNDHISNWHTAGYFNTTSAITRIDFRFEAGNIDDGTIALYGLK